MICQDAAEPFWNFIRTALTSRRWDHARVNDGENHKQRNEEDSDPFSSSPAIRGLSHRHQRLTIEFARAEYLCSSIRGNHPFLLSPLLTSGK
jgi:hypothetical protein